MEDGLSSELDSYLPGTIVWVKLPRFSWWPAEVCFIHKLSIMLLRSMLYVVCMLFVVKGRCPKNNGRKGEKGVRDKNLWRQ